MFLEFAEGKVSAEVWQPLTGTLGTKDMAFHLLPTPFNDTLQKQCKALADKWISGEGGSANDAKSTDSA